MNVSARIRWKLDLEGKAVMSKVSGGPCTQAPPTHRKQVVQFQDPLLLQQLQWGCRTLKGNWRRPSRKNRDLRIHIENVIEVEAVTGAIVARR